VVLPEKLLTVREVAGRLGVCRATVYSMVERRELPAVRIGAAVRVHPADLQVLVARRRGEKR
jgi:excisionase family DNA binding protein